MRNADYWRGRFSILEDSAHREAQKTIQDMEELYLDAQRSVQKEIESWYARFAGNNQISLTDARKWLTAGQLEEFHWSVEQYIKIGEQAGLDAAWLKKLENASTRFHISRLEAVQTGIQQQLELLYGNQVDSLDALLKKVVGNGYTHTAFEVQKGVGLGWDITGLDQKKLETLLSKPWTTDGRTFRDRCWLNKNDLVGSVSKSLTQGLLRGDSPAKITTAIQKQFGVHRYKAGRLVNTETTYFNAVATKECYKDLDVEMVEIIETLDSHTCSICGGLDGKVIPISQYEPGVTVPPFHPNCRGTTAPAIDPKYAGERAARNADGDVYYVPANMKYADWVQTFVNGGSKAGLTAATATAILDIVEQATGAKKGTSMAIQDAVKGANPNYSRGSAYGVNCQRCVQAYEFRRRGYDVVAKPKPSTNNIISWGSECFIQPGAYQYSYQAYALNQTEAAVKKALANAPDGSRFSIYIKWKRTYGGSAHVFIAEKTGGVVHYLDPQTGNMDASDYFTRGSKGCFGYFRLDDKALTTDPNIISATVEVK
jgi:SPP1 gp7 family putative phage head morphogenesis protein|nr:MAG: minor capsid protein 2 [Bacteriophage sp.]